MKWISVIDGLPKLDQSVLLWQEALGMYHITTGVLKRIPIDDDQYNIEWRTPLLGKPLTIKNVEYWMDIEDIPPPKISE